VDIAAAPRPDADIPADDAMLRNACAKANIPALLMVLAQLTGEERWLSAPYVPSRTRGMDDNDSGGLPAAIQDEIRRAAYDTLRMTSSGPPASVPAPDDVVRMMSTSMGESIPPEYGEMMLEELGFQTRQPGWPASPSAEAVADFTVAIIGAGVSGICAGISLQRAGIPFIIFEKSDSVGGTWLDNVYPGCGVDTPSHLYSFSFAPRSWSRYFAKQPEIREYLERCVDTFGIASAIRLETKVLSARFDQATGKWTVDARRADGVTTSTIANVVISAVGQLNQPAEPAIDGAEHFRGEILHAARWPADLEVIGKRVVVIGSGATAMQVVPAIADTVSRVSIFQRSPQWAAPSTNYQREVPSEIQYLVDRVPLYGAWYRCRLVWSYSDKVHESLQIDPDWPGRPESINAANEGHRRYFTRYLTQQLAEREDLIPRVVPRYPPFGKRMLIDNGWFRTLTKDNVDLVDDGIDHISEYGVVDASGRLHQADVIVYATGFQTLRMVGSYDVYGRDGASLRDEWGEEDARAYLGITVPKFPNFFCLYGPNTGLGHGGSLILLTECATRYIVALIQRMIVEGIDTLEVRKDVFDRYNEQLDAAHEKMIWAHPGTTNWYRNSRGRVVTNFPWRIVDYWQMTRHPDMSDFLAARLPSGSRPVGTDAGRPRRASQ
jgi:4-hydroxyacetophenone monooxygenase